MSNRRIAGDGASVTDRPTVRYTGRRTEAGTEVVRHADDGSTSPLAWRLDLRNHSPTGFEWGYGGSGPAQLALAILADTLGPEQAQGHYQDFKWKVIARLDKGDWEITREQVQEWVSQRQEHGR